MLLAASLTVSWDLLSYGKGLPVLPQVISVINGKGGVGKTSLTTNLGGLFAAAGLRVLLVDADPQGNAGRDLGYLAAGRSDDGRSLFAAVTLGQPIEPLKGVRHNLDVVCGGELTAEMVGTLATRGRRTGDTTGALRDALAPIAGDYDLILIDCPPGEQVLQVMALTASRFVIIPTTSDEASIDGLGRVARLFDDIQSTTNPELELLGIAPFRVGSRSERIAAELRDSIVSTGLDPELLFAARIRGVEGPAQSCRKMGKLVHELEAELPEARARRLAWLRDGREGGRHRAKVVAESTPGLADDYQRLAMEVSDRMTASDALTPA